MNAATVTPLIRTERDWPVRFGPLVAALVVPFILPTFPAWAVMGTTAAAIWFGCKWAMTFRHGLAIGTGRLAAYWLLWPGMDPGPFAGQTSQAPNLGDWIQGILLAVVGAILVFGVAPRFIQQNAVLGGWLGWVGLILLLHFGVFHLLATALRLAGIPVRPLMQNPLAATSLADFWGRRWNHAFQEVAHRFLFKPVARQAGVAAATMTVFLVSGLVHEWVITIPARGGYGLPTAYFLIQGAGLLLEHSKTGRALGLEHGITGRFYALTVAALPVALLFPPPFLREVIVPLIRAVTGI